MGHESRVQDCKPLNSQLKLLSTRFCLSFNKPSCHEEENPTPESEEAGKKGHRAPTPWLPLPQTPTASLRL